MSSIILTINLQGQIEGMIKHVDKQIYSVDVAPLGAKHPEIVHRKIKHSDRMPTKCTRKVTLSEETISSFYGECPFWEKPGNWSKMSKEQKLHSHLNRYDEGFGYSYDKIETLD